MVPGECFPALGNPKLCPVQDYTGSRPAAWGRTESTCRRKHPCHPPPLAEGGCIPTRAVRTWPEWPSPGWRWVLLSLGLLRAAIPCHGWRSTPQGAMGDACISISWWFGQQILALWVGWRQSTSSPSAPHQLPDQQLHADAVPLTRVQWQFMNVHANMCAPNLPVSSQIC